MKHSFKNTFLRAVTLVLCFVLVTQSVFAASTGSTFTTSLTTTGAVSTPPGVPTNPVATPVSDTQIDLNWTASVAGSYAIDGYRIFRDGIFLATTSVTTSYSDLGLTASTTYAYTVEAFDTVLQLSGQSATTSTTTLQTPVVQLTPTPTPAAGGSSGSSGSIIPQISNIVIAPDFTQATVSFDTNVPTQAKVYWGKSTDYEGGSLSALVYGTSHELQISGLESGTNYFVKIEVANSQGVTVSAPALFSTKSVAPVYPLANPSNFVATPVGSDVHVSWTNPSDPRFDSVRVVRSETFFPVDQFDGVPVYEGSAQSFIDTAVTVGKTYYYAIFAKAKDGSFSSGALSKARVAPAGEIVIPATSTDPFANIPESANVDPRLKGLMLADFEFIQEGRLLAQVNNTVIAVNGSENLVIRLKYEKVPEILKTIAFTLADPTDATKVFPFLLRVNKDKTYYEATLAPLGRSGSYAMSIVVLDYQNKGLVRLKGSLQALAFAAVAAEIRRGFDPAGFLLLLFLILSLLLLLLLLRRKVKKHYEQTEQYREPQPVIVTSVRK